jgi:ubiquinone/menaquinone biosynthesis C-methylase UbiE
MNTTPSSPPQPGQQNFWESEIYSKGQQLCRYPFDNIVTFIYRNYPRHKPRSEIRILELGSGAGNNLWFAAREGFQVYGIEFSESAVAFARDRFAQDGLQGHFIVGSFTHLPFEENFFDLIFDRGSLVCVSFPDACKTIREAARVLLPGGRLFLNPYSRAHTSFSCGRLDEATLLTRDIAGGTLVGVGSLCFYDEKMVDALITESGLQIISKKHKVITEIAHGVEQHIHAEWEVTAQKP